LFPWANRKRTASNISFQYFGEIDQEKTQELLEIFKIDFEMFGYTAEEYFDAKE
jgi:hypothetical protein